MIHDVSDYFYISSLSLFFYYHASDNKSDWSCLSHLISSFDKFK